MLNTILQYAGGRTLGLFTSRRAVDLAYESVQATCKRLGVRLLRQGEMPRPQLIATFREDVTSVLLGTESLWTGVDVPGESCSVVVIDRIPFARPDDPIVDALQDERSPHYDPDWFQHHYVPRAIIAFRQGFGRLIRSSRDRGVVVCLDNRLLSKGYAKQFLRALPPVTKSTHLTALVEWLHEE
jgi:ATP-dependent DNA helicase DinG